MRSRVIIIGVLAAVSSGAWGCGGDDGGDTPPNGGGNCPAVQACGGDPVGDWSSDDVCVSDPDKLFEGAVNQPECKDALTDSSAIDTSGTYSLTADKKVNSDIKLSGTGTFLFNDACVKALEVAQSAAAECSKIQAELSKQSGVKSATCTAKAPNCECVMSLETALKGMSTYTVADNKITVMGVAQPFCVQGSKLTLQSTANGVTTTFTMSKK
jgi:hypothetical protein